MSQELIPQEHGGALLPGGKPGNRGGGALRSEARERALGGGNKGITLLDEYLDEIIKLREETNKPLSEIVKSSELTRIVECLAKYGLGEIQNVVESEAIFHAFKDGMIEEGFDREKIANVLQYVKRAIGS